MPSRCMYKLLNLLLNSFNKEEWFRLCSCSWKPLRLDTGVADNPTNNRTRWGDDLVHSRGSPNNTWPRGNYLPSYHGFNRTYTVSPSHLSSPVFVVTWWGWELNVVSIHSTRSVTEDWTTLCCLTYLFNTYFGVENHLPCRLVQI